MQFKTITYQRVLNLGNYESKRLEMTADIGENDDYEAATGILMKTVEQKLREDASKEFRKQILDLEARKENLLDEIAKLKDELKQLGKIKDEPRKEEVDTEDDIPFNVGESSQVDDTMGSF